MSNSNQHGLTSPISTAPGRHGGAPQYSFNSDGSLTTNGASMNVIGYSYRNPEMLCKLHHTTSDIKSIRDFKNDWFADAIH